MALYGYCLNDPVNLVDPRGLWKISIHGYWGWGVGFTFGDNPNGKPFITFRGGFGYGGGITYDPTGKSPGVSPCKSVGGVSIGAYGEAGIGFRNIGASINSDFEYLFTPGAQSDHPYASISSNIVGNNNWRYSYGGGFGIEIGLIE